MIKKILFLFAFVNSVNLYAESNFISGIGYIKPDQYRKDNDVNPLPLGLSVVPMIAYQSKTLKVFGPNIRYTLLNGMYGAELKMNVAGDRYESHDLELRNTTINAGASVRFMFLSLDYESDIGHTYNGNLYRLTLAKPFIFGSFMFIPRIAKEYVNEGFTRYYYGVKADEAGYYSEYSLNTAVNEIYSIMLNYRMNKKTSIAFNLTHKVFDKVIAKSPTIDLDRYNTVSLFWNYKIGE